MKFQLPMYSCLVGLFCLFLSCENLTSLEINKEVNQTQNSEEKPDFEAKVIRIIDGDTMEVLYGELPVTIRLQHIDCPEKKGNQPFGNKAKQTLSDLCFGQSIEIKYSGDKDRNGRYICELFTIDGLNINQEMIKKGMAWHYKKYSNDNQYAELENEARKNKIGLWSEPNPTPPWEWRK